MSSSAPYASEGVSTLRLRCELLQKDLEIRDLKYQAQERQLKDYAEKLRAAEEELQTKKA